MTGFDVSVTKKGYKVVRLHYTADPDKRTEEWQKRTKAAMPDPQSFRREFEIDWSATTGKPYYPEFVRNYAADKSYYCQEFELFDKSVPIYRGWDFGFRRPGCVWFQVGAQGKVFVHRELMPEEIDIHSYRDLVMYLSGQIDVEDKSLRRRPRALSYLDVLSEKGELPWFEYKKHTFIDFSGPEATAVKTIESEKGERNDSEVLASRDIFIAALSQRVSAGEHILRRLLLPQPSGGAGIVFHDGRCPLLVGGMNGGLTHKKGTRANPLDDKCAKDGHFEHLHDGLRYGLVGAVTLDEHYPEPQEKVFPRSPWETDYEELPQDVESYIEQGWEEW